MNIIKKTSTHNTSSRPGRKIRFIVLHYTAGVTSKPGSAINNANYFATTERQGSADFCVDDRDIVQYNGDLENRYTWAVGGKKYTYMTTRQGGIFYGQCLNNNSVSIEMCSNKTNRKSLLATDTDWYLTEATVANAVELTVYLAKKYKVPMERIIMHHQVNGKPCPQPWCRNEGALNHWYEFRRKVEAALSGEQEDDMTEAQTAKLVSAAMAEERASLMTEIRKQIEGVKGKVYNTPEEIPEWYQEGYLYFKPVLQGKETGLALTEDMLRIMTLLARMK